MSNDIPGSYRDGTSGWSGGETSRARAEREDRRLTGRRQRQAYDILARRGYMGVTVRELEELYGVGHGAASGILSRMHRAGQAVRLTYTRGDQQVYVLPECAGEREQAPYRPQKGIAHVTSTEVGRLTQIAASVAYAAARVSWHEEERNAFEEQLHEWLQDNKIEVVDDIT